MVSCNLLANHGVNLDGHSQQNKRGTRQSRVQQQNRIQRKGRKGEEEGKAKEKKLPGYITFSELKWIFINGGSDSVYMLVCD